MEQLLIILPILIALLFGAMSPGPSFIVIGKVSLSGSRNKGIATAVGLGFGSAVFGCLALTGLHIVLEQVTWLYVVFKILGGTYLLYLAYNICRGARSPLVLSAQDEIPIAADDLRKAFFVGMVTQLSNPKTAIVFAGVFATFLPTGPELWVYFVLVPLIFLMETVWYTVLAVAFSSERPRKAYQRVKTPIDRFASFLLGAMGISLLKSSL